MDAMVEAMKPYIGMIFAIWFISEVITAMFRLHRKKSYQDRRMANDAEHAKVTRAMHYDVLHRDGFHCVRCGRGREDGVKLHVDHIVPVSRGGESVMGNLQTLCEVCNCGKGNRYLE
ncbi:HNH endonuclease [Gordonibacter pamelaeae]|nr:HNH endonuclease [Gordonibacter pamelaeae]